jgi:putative tricarboxylic transport membrane protein
MVVFGLIGFISIAAGYPVSPIILAIILGPIMETSIRQALINTGSVGSLLGSFVTRPISLVIIILVVGSFVLQARSSRRWHSLRPRTETEAEKEERKK